MGYTIYPFGVTEVKPENFDGDLYNAFSPETSALLKGLGDSPESLQLKAEYMQSINKLRRGRLYWPIVFVNHGRYSICSNIGYRNFHHCNPSIRNPAGYSSGSAGGSVTPKTSGIQDSVSEPPAAQTTPEPSPPAVPQTPEAAAKAEVPAEDTVAKVEQEMLEQLKGRMRDLESKFLDEIMTRKREAEQELENEMASKKQRLQKEVEDLVEEKSEQESKLALVSEQLQEKMLCISEEQNVLDELREKSRVMQQKLLEAAPKNTGGDNDEEENDEQKKLKQKEALKLKLAQKASPQAPMTSPPPSTMSEAVPTPPVVPPVDTVMVPTSTQRFTSSTHPEAWQYLYRLTKDPKKCDEEIYNAWHEGEYGKRIIFKPFL